MAVGCVPRSSSDSAAASTPTSQAAAPESASGSAGTPASQAAAAPESESAAPAAGSGDPQTREARAAHLKAVARIGDAITASLKVGGTLDGLRAVARTTSDVVLEESSGEAVCTLAGDVTWNVTTGARGTILGYSFSGYDPLMSRLGVDFGGNVYLEGN